MFVHTDHIFFFLETEQLIPKTNTIVRKVRVLCFRNQIYKKRKQCRCRRFKQETRLPKFKQIDKTNVDQKRQLHGNN